MRADTVRLGRSFTRVDDHLVQPEVTRDEIIEGRRVVVFPADPPKATQHGDLHYAVRAYVAPGYRGALGLLTRHGKSRTLPAAPVSTRTS